MARVVLRGIEHGPLVGVEAQHAAPCGLGVIDRGPQRFVVAGPQVALEPDDADAHTGRFAHGFQRMLAIGGDGA